MKRDLEVACKYGSGDMAGSDPEPIPGLRARQGAWREKAGPDPLRTIGPGRERINLCAPDLCNGKAQPFQPLSAKDGDRRRKKKGGCACKFGRYGHLVPEFRTVLNLHKQNAGHTPGLSSSRSSQANERSSCFMAVDTAAECRLSLRSKTIHSGDNSNGDPGGDEAVFNAIATRGRRPSRSALCC